MTHVDKGAFTDFVSISVAMASKPPVALPAKSMGNLDNGHYHVDLSIPDIEVHPTAPVSFVYSIVSSGYDKNEMEQKLFVPPNLLYRAERALVRDG